METITHSNVGLKVIENPSYLRICLWRVSIFIWR